MTSDGFDWRKRFEREILGLRLGFYTVWVIRGGVLNFEIRIKGESWKGVSW